MNETSPSQPLAVIACQIFQALLAKLLPADMVSRATFLDYGLHNTPKKLTDSVQSAIDSLATPSLILLGYGLCGNGLDGITAGAHTLLIPRTDDCIAVLLGSYQKYRQHFDSEPGTYWLSKGWLEAGTNPLAEHDLYVEKYGAETAAWLMDQQYQHYNRLAFVAHNPEDLAEYRPQAKAVAAYCNQWEMRYQEILGSDDYVGRLVAVAHDLSLADDDFLVVPPGGKLEQIMFLRDS